MYIKTLHLEAYRRFRDFDIDFDPSLTVIAARNGQGKTTVLEAIASALGPFVGAFDEGRGTVLQPPAPVDRDVLEQRSPGVVTLHRGLARH